jgi:asparagine synthase (glutamine-hydrolysing)
MCGIAGAFVPGAAPGRAPVEAMLDTIAHRGPDGRGVVEAGPVVLGHVRLSILDLSDRAAQPMWSHDGRFLITYNGEVYNFADLRDRVLSAGASLVSSGDTEALLEHIALFGLVDTIRRIEGFFSFALWDTSERVLTLVRDRLGKKPLYWSSSDGEVRFASEMKALVTGATRPDLTTLDGMMLGFPATWGTATPFEGIEAVEAGSIVQFCGSVQPSSRRWFAMEELVDPQLYAELDSADDHDVVDRLDEAFRRSLRFRMVSDVPVASLVSGGVDSSLVTVLAAREGTQPPSLYHADVVADSERVPAQAVADYVQRPLHVAVVSDSSFLAQVARATWFNDLPLTYHVNAVPFLSVCERAGADGVKVLLSGEGSDEFFLGYPQYGLASYLDAMAGVKRRVRGLARRAAPRIVDQVWPSAATSRATMLRELVSRGEANLLDGTAMAFTAHLRSRADERAHVASLSLAQGHLSSLLHRNDRLGMAAGIENRFPFLGSDVTRLAVNLPARFKLRWGSRVHDRRHPFVVDKWLVRELAARRLPQALAMREKQGFPVRVQQRLRVRPAMLHGGFVSQHWRLTDEAVDAVFEGTDPSWHLGLALVEIWGRLLLRNEPIEDVARLLDRSIER